MTKNEVLKLKTGDTIYSSSDSQWIDNRSCEYTVESIESDGEAVIFQPRPGSIDYLTRKEPYERTIYYSHICSTKKEALEAIISGLESEKGRAERELENIVAEEEKEES